MIRRLLGNRSENRSLSFQDVWGRGLAMTSARSSSGEVVTFDSALTLSAVYAAIRLLSDNVSTLSLDVLYRSAGSERKFRPMPTWMDQMNPELRNHEVLGQIVTSLLLDGNAYISTLRDQTGRVVSISVLDPKTVTPRMKPDQDGLSRITFQSDQAQGVEFTSRDIVMVRNLMKPGQIEGVSPITAAREFIGLGLATVRYGSYFF